MTDTPERKLDRITALLPPDQGPLEDRVKRLVDFYYAASQDLILAADLIYPGFEGDIHTLIHDMTMEAQS